jgi:ABC-type multidrug transport system ATPase subunit
MWQTIRDLAAQGVTIFLTTQYLEEADQLSDRIAVLDHGRIVAEGTTGELKRQIPGGHIQLQFENLDELTSAERVLGVSSRDEESLSLQVPSDGDIPALRALLDQPFTPVIQTVRGLLAGGPIGDNAIMAIAWGVGIAALSYLWARRLYRRPMQAK